MVICGAAAAIGGLVGVLSGASQGGSVISKAFTGLIHGVGTAVISGFVALLAVAVASLVWGIASSAARRSWRAVRDGSH